MNETATQQIERAFELRRRELRARQLADMAVALALEEQRKSGDDPHRKPLAYAADVATLATSILIERIYSEDRELVAVRKELALYRERVLDLANLMPAPVRLIIPTPRKEGEQ